MASPNNFFFPPPYPFQPPPPPSHPISPPPPPPHHPGTPPPPPHHPIRPPPPHVRPPPPAPPSPSPDNHSTVIVIVFVSFGGVLFLACLAAAICWFIKKRKKKPVQETDLVHFDEHLKVKEAIVPGPHGRPQAVILEMEDDLHVDEVIKKNEKFGENLHAKSADSRNPVSLIEKGESSLGSDHHHRQTEHET